MKIRIEIDDSREEDAVVIQCREVNAEIMKIQNAISEISNQKKQFVCYKEETQYFLPLDTILFFETGENGVNVHTADDMFQAKYKLYELEEILPGSFMRVSKSTILNTNHIFSITRNLTASSVVELNGTYKQVYVSRYYYKPLLCKLEEKRRQLL